MNAISLAFFISPHGLGHAARAAAVMEAVRGALPNVQFEIFTTVPEWFFRESLTGPFTYHPVVTDIGLVQKNPFHENLHETVDALDRFFPPEVSRIEPLAQRIADSRCRLVLCDISPVGILVGRAAGVPSALIENFTWDWIYHAYVDQDPRIRKHMAYLENLYGQVTHHIRTEPVCGPRKSRFHLPPISRSPRKPGKEIRKALEVPRGSPMVFITMGGIPQRYTIQNAFGTLPEFFFVIAGGIDSVRRGGNWVMLPYQSPFYHPDLIHSADVVVGKAGYSTLAEVYDAGIPFLFVKRSTFRESDVISDYVDAHMSGAAITETDFENGGWLTRLEGLLAAPRRQRNGKTGARQIAEIICTLLGGESKKRGTGIQGAIGAGLA